MAFFEKLNQMAKNLGDKTTDAIEVTKLNGKIASEKLAANEELLKIGQFYYNRYLNGYAEDEIVEYCNKAKEHFDQADSLQAQVDGIQGVTASGTSNMNANVKYCTNCGASLPVETKFCNQCGAKL